MNWTTHRTLPVDLVVWLPGYADPVYARLRYDFTRTGYTGRTRLPVRLHTHSYPFTRIGSRTLLHDLDTRFPHTHGRAQLICYTRLRFDSRFCNFPVTDYTFVYHAPHGLRLDTVYGYYTRDSHSCYGPCRTPTRWVTHWFAVVTVPRSSHPAFTVVTHCSYYSCWLPLVCTTLIDYTVTRCLHLRCHLVPHVWLFVRFTFTAHVGWLRTRFTRFGWLVWLHLRLRVCTDTRLRTARTFITVALRTYPTFTFTHLFHPHVTWFTVARALRGYTLRVYILPHPVCTVIAHAHTRTVYVYVLHTRLRLRLHLPSYIWFPHVG